MYRVYQLTDEEKNKIIRLRCDGDTHYYDVFELQEECDEEQKRLDEIETEYRKKKADYLKNCKGERLKCVNGKLNKCENLNQFSKQMATVKSGVTVVILFTVMERTRLQ